MRPIPPCPAATSLWILATLTAPACISDSVPPDIDAERNEPSAGSDRESASGAEASATDRGTQRAGQANSATNELETPELPAGASAGSCELGGHWLITQRTVASGLGVKQRAAWWFYYEMEQSGTALRVKRGLVCGGQVFPVDPLSAAVEFDASFPALIEKNSHAGRRGTVVSDGSDCRVSFEPATIVLGATTPFYADEKTPLPTFDEPAADGVARGQCPSSAGTTRSRVHSEHAGRPAHGTLGSMFNTSRRPSRSSGAAPTTSTMIASGRATRSSTSSRSARAS